MQKAGRHRVEEGHGGRGAARSSTQSTDTVELLTRTSEPEAVKRNHQQLDIDAGFSGPACRILLHTAAAGSEAPPSHCPCLARIEVEVDVCRQAGGQAWGHTYTAVMHGGWTVMIGGGK